MSIATGATYTAARSTSAGCFPDTRVVLTKTLHVVLTKVKVHVNTDGTSDGTSTVYTLSTLESPAGGDPSPVCLHSEDTDGDAQAVAAVERQVIAYHAWSNNTARSDDWRAAVRGTGPQYV